MESRKHEVPGTRRPDFFEEIETELRIRHPEIQKNPAFLVLLADGLLNSLAEDKTEIGLGELGVGA